MRNTMLVEIARDAVVALGRELAAWKPSAERALFGIEAVISVGLSVAFAHMLKLPDVWWAAISGFAVMQTSFASSVERAMLRVLGTILGALIGVLAGPQISDLPWLFVPLLGAISGYTIYRANAGSASYGWVLGGVTAVMVIYEAHQLHTFQPTAHFAMLRVLDVCVGVFACVLVSGLFHVGRRWFGQHGLASKSDEAPNSMSIGTQPSFETQRLVRAELAIQAAIAVLIVAALTYAFKLPGLAQALVTIIAVLILPSSQLVPSRKPVMQKMVQRMIGCLVAGPVGILLLPVVSGHEIAYLLALSAGVWVGCHLQTGQKGASYIGRQFAIAFLLVFVQDSFWAVNPTAAALRFAGIVGGIVALGGMMLVWNKFDLSPSAHDVLR
jgi:uncharacterized membrane protein YccC